jgi:hypothetical protein
VKGVSSRAEGAVEFGCHFPIFLTLFARDPALWRWVFPSILAKATVIYIFRK